MSPSSDNFGFVGPYDRRVGQLADQAERYVHTDPDSCLFKLRLMIETMARRLIEMQMPHLISTDLSTMLRSLESSGTLPRQQADGMHSIRRDGNAAIHGTITAMPTAMRRLRDAHRLSGWYCRTIQRGAEVRLEDFVAPPCPKAIDQRVRAALRQAETLEDEIEASRRRTREALLLFGTDVDVEAIVTRHRVELRSLERIAAAAGEPTVDADSVALIMAMDVQQLLEDRNLGGDAREAKREAERQLDDVKRHLEEHEREYAAERERLAECALDELEREDA